MSAQKAYDELIKRAREVSLLVSCESVLGWDERTYMPRGGAAFRAEQLGLLSGLAHEKFTDPRIGELLTQVEQSDLIKDDDSMEAANVRELRYQYDKQTKLPKELVEEITRVTFSPGSKRSSNCKKTKPMPTATRVSLTTLCWTITNPAPRSSRSSTSFPVCATIWSNCWAK